MSACDACLRRSALLGALSGHLEIAWRAGRGPGGPRDVLGLGDAALIEAVGADDAEIGRRTDGDGASRRRAALAVGLELACRHDPELPWRLDDLDDPPAVLHHDDPRGLLQHRGPTVALVGSRRATPVGLEVAREVAAGVAEAGAVVISGMALGVDAAAHEGALAVGGGTIAVMPGGADVAYPASRAALHARIRAEGAVVAELPPGTAPRRWTFPARNRIIAALADVVVVVEAAARSGSLITARRALDLGRDVAAVPGPVRGGRSDGTNALLHDGAHVVRHADDVLDLLGAAPPPPPGAGHRSPAARPEGGAATAPGDEPAPGGAPPGPAGLLLRRLRDGARTLDALVEGPERASLLLALTELEAAGRLRRGPDGTYAPQPTRAAGGTRGDGPRLGAWPSARPSP